MILTIIMATLAACGALLIMWTLLDALRLPRENEGSFYVVLVGGDAATAQQTMRAALRQCQRCGLHARLIFVDDGLNPEGQIAAQLLLRQQDNALLCSAVQLPEIIRTENEEIGTGAD